MNRRCAGHDYAERQMYMVTMVTEGRQKLFGDVVGTSDAPRMELSDLGRAVEAEWWGIRDYYPQIELRALQMMPDHFHGILFVRERLPKPLGHVLRSFKVGCNRAYRRLVLGQQPVSYVATQSQRTEQQGAEQQRTEQLNSERPKRDRHGEDRQHGLLFAPGYNDKLLLRQGQYDIWLNYLRDNPRRLLLKREHPDLFHVQRNLTVASQTFSAIGNRFLLSRPVRLQVQCSRKLTEAEIKERVAYFLKAAEEGAVLVSPSISPGEKAVMRAAFDAGFPIIILRKNGFTDLAKPGGASMAACAEGRLLLLAPWQHHNERISITRNQCLTLNDFARLIASQT